MNWKELKPGLLVTEGGSAETYKTGDWRSEHPEWNCDQCVRCGVCYLFCPEASIHMNDEGYPEVDPFFCKGCGICAKECWTGCIKILPGGEMPENKVKDKTCNKKEGR